MMTRYMTRKQAETFMAAFYFTPEDVARSLDKAGREGIAKLGMHVTVRYLNASRRYSFEIGDM